jgi:hypothetical protein
VGNPSSLRSISGSWLEQWTYACKYVHMYVCVDESISVSWLAQQTHVSMYALCMHACVRVCSVYIKVWKYTRIHTSTYAHAHTQTNTSVNTRIHMFNTHAYRHTHPSKRRATHTNIHVYKLAWTHQDTYIHTLMHTYIPILHRSEEPSRKVRLQVFATGFGGYPDQHDTPTIGRVLRKFCSMHKFCSVNSVVNSVA